MEKFIVFLLVMFRTVGIFALTPVFGSRQIPMQCRTAIALSLALVFVPMVPVKVELATEMLPLLVMVVREALVGLTIGFVCSLVFTTIHIAGEFIDFQSGLAFASMVDPVNGTNAGIMGRFQNMIALLLFLATNSHHFVIKGLADSFVIAPIGQASIDPAMAEGMIVLFSKLFLIAVRISLPIVGAILISDVAMGILSRVVPQMNVLVVGMPIKLGVALVAMIIAIPVIASMSQGLFGEMYQQIGITAKQMAMF